ncbi:MAG: lipoyl synthase [bacterium]|nr:lipoyl synthase [bacterium]
MNAITSTIREQARKSKRSPKPQWLKADIPSGDNYFKVKRQMESRGLATICQQARCPNITECWNNKHATFLIMGELCTRSCSFCSVKPGKPGPLMEDEAEKVLEMVDILNANYVVITSVTRDDLPDGGSAHFARVVSHLKTHRPDVKIEILIPDFKGIEQQLNTVLQAGPHVLNHNLETVKRLYNHVKRPARNYGISLEVLRRSHEKGFITKSGMMVGLGETVDEMKKTFEDLRANNVDLLTVGQYLQPTKIHAAVEKYYTPDQFLQLKEIALTFGFTAVEAGPFVRSSYNAGLMYEKCLE